MDYIEYIIGISLFQIFDIYSGALREVDYDPRKSHYEQIKQFFAAIGLNSFFIGLNPCYPCAIFRICTSNEEVIILNN